MESDENPNASLTRSSKVQSEQMCRDQVEETRLELIGNNGRFQSWKNRFIILAVVVGACGIVALKKQAEPVKDRTSKKPALIDFKPLIETHAAQARGRNKNALDIFKLELSGILLEMKPRLQDAALLASKEASEYGSCCAIVYYLAWDKANGNNQAETYLNDLVRPIIEPEIVELSRKIDTSVQNFEQELRESSLIMAQDLAALSPSWKKLDIQVNIDSLSEADFQKSLRGLGFNGVAVGVALPLDLVLVTKSNFFRGLWGKIKAIAGKLFGKQVAKLTVSAAAAAADGPLPVGDALAIGGLIWTGYDIHAARKQFEADLNTTINNTLFDATNSINRQAEDHVRLMLKSYQSLQDTIGTNSLKQLPGGSP